MFLKLQNLKLWIPISVERYQLVQALAEWLLLFLFHTFHVSHKYYGALSVHGKWL